MVQRVKYHKIQLQCLFQRFLNQTLCVFIQIKDIKHIKWDFHLVTRVMPQGWDLGGGVQKVKLFEHGHVAYQIKGMISRTGYK